MRNWFRYGIASGVFITYLLLLPLVGSFAVYTAKEALRTGYGIWLPILLFGGIGFGLVFGIVGSLIYFSKSIVAFFTGAFIKKAWLTTKVTKKMVVAVTPDHLKQSIAAKKDELIQDWAFPILVSSVGSFITVCAIGFLSRYAYLLVKNPTIWSFVIVVIASIIVVVCNFLILNVLGFTQDILEWMERRKNGTS